MIDSEKDFRAELQRIAAEARERIGRGLAAYLKAAGKEETTDREKIGAIFLASLRSVSDLISHGEQGPSATAGLHQALKLQD